MNGKFYLNMRKTFSVEVTEHWNTLPREGTEFPLPRIFTNRLDTILCPGMTLLEQVGPDDHPV